MPTSPSLPKYVGIAAFLTVLAVFVTSGLREDPFQLGRFAFILAFSAIHVVVT